jgi:glycosidase
MPDFNFATFLTNHDQDRSMSVFNGDPGKAKVAATLLLTAPGTPFIYYGEEVGMPGQKPDENIRLPMQWNAEANAGFTTGIPWRAPASDYPQVNVAVQEADSNSLLNHYRELIQLRRKNTALSRGEITLLDADNTGVYAVLRSTADQTLLVIVNLTAISISDYQLSLDENLLSDGTITPHSWFGTMETRPVTISGGKFSEYKPFNELLPYASYILEME